MLNIGVQVGNDYILIVVSGTGGVAEMQSMNVFVGDLLTRTGRRRVLLDSLAFESALGPDPDDAGRKAIIGHMAATMPDLERVAILVPKDGRRGFIRAAAQARGFEAEEFSDIVQAEKWLQA